MARERIRIGGASGYWGDAPGATAQLLAARPDFLVYDYLAEVTLGLMARMRARDPAAAYARDFVTAAMAPNLARIAELGTRVITNAGGLDPEACAEALRAEIARQGLALRVATVAGDDLMPALDAIAAAAPPDLVSGRPFPAREAVRAANAYLGAFPIAAALDSGADIVITGRCVDSAPTLAAAIHSFGWGPDALDLLAAGSLAGHLLECGAQATGGNFTDWRAASPPERIGYPLADLAADGSFTLTKPEGTGGLVTPATVGEQLVYEIGDPAAYVLPDVICDFSRVTLTQAGPDRVAVAGARGRGVPEALKVALIFEDGWRVNHLLGFYGIEAAAKARAYAEATLARTRAALAAAGAAPLSETCVEVLGAGAQLGRFDEEAQEVTLHLAARHPEPRALAVLGKELAGLALAGPPGICGFAAGRGRPTPVMAFHGFLWPKARVEVEVRTAEGTALACPPAPAIAARPAEVPTPPPPPPPGPRVEVPLVRLAWARSGDKGDAANIGVIPRDPAHLPALWHALDEAHLRATFAHVQPAGAPIRRYLLPGLPALNIVLEQALGGGGLSSLRHDPQGKGFAQLLLMRPVSVPAEIAPAP